MENVCISTEAKQRTGIRMLNTRTVHLLSGKISVNEEEFTNVEMYEQEPIIPVLEVFNG